ncbi:MAG TPA: OsmC family protein [Thermoleophilaceae bacterium]|nr:OsmC family protein [Thermoleophilaceae bacterium]
MDAIRSAVEKAVRHYEQDPDAGREQDSPATAVHDGGLRFRVSGPHGEVVSDGSESVGGGASAPTPGWYLRAAIAACDATVIAIEAARAGISLSRLEVSVSSETDFRGTLAVDDSVPAGPLAVRVRVHIASDDADEEALRALVERSEALSVVGDAVSRATPLTTEIVVGD